MPANFTEAEVLELLEQQGYTRVHARERRRSSRSCRTGCGSAAPIARAVIEALEAALRVGRGRVNVYLLRRIDGAGA